MDEELLSELALTELYHDTRVQPTSSDVLAAKAAKRICDAAIRGTLEVELLGGGHAAFRGSAPMADANSIKSATAQMGVQWAVHRYSDPPTDFGTLELQDGASVHVHRQQGGGDGEDDAVTMYLAPGAGRAALKKALEQGGFKV